MPRWFNCAMDLIRHLRFFVAVAEEGHFSRAAATLDMTQPPLSQGLRKLEDHVGLPLVRRTPRGAVLTTAGAALLPRARLLVDDAERFFAEAARIAGARGRVHWGATAALSDRTVMLCVTALRTPVSGVESTVSTEIASTVDLVESVRSGLCDVAVVEHPALVDGIHAGPVVKLPRWIVVPANHRSATAGRPTFPMLSDLTFARTARAANPPAFDAVRDLLRERGADSATVTVRDDRTVLSSVVAGGCFGLTTTPPGAVPGAAWLRLAPDAVALRVRVVRRMNTIDNASADALDRVLFRERVK